MLTSSHLCCSTPRTTLKPQTMSACSRTPARRLTSMLSPRASPNPMSFPSLLWVSALCSPTRAAKLTLWLHLAWRAFEIRNLAHQGDGQIPLLLELDALRLCWQVRSSCHTYIPQILSADKLLNTAGTRLPAMLPICTPAPSRPLQVTRRWLTTTRRVCPTTSSLSVRKA